MAILLDDPEFSRLLLALWWAIVAGVIYALSGFFKREETKETFSGEKFLTTAIVGVIAGFVSFYMNVTIEQAFALVAADVGFVVIIENVVKAIWRRWITPWMQEQAKKQTPPTQ